MARKADRQALTDAIINHGTLHGARHIAIFGRQIDGDRNIVMDVPANYPPLLEHLVPTTARDIRRQSPDELPYVHWAQRVHAAPPTTTPDTRLEITVHAPMFGRTWVMLAMTGLTITLTLSVAVTIYTIVLTVPSHTSIGYVPPIPPLRRYDEPAARTLAIEQAGPRVQFIRLDHDNPHIKPGHTLRYEAETDSLVPTHLHEQPPDHYNPPPSVRLAHNASAIIVRAFPDVTWTVHEKAHGCLIIQPNQPLHESTNE